MSQIVITNAGIAAANAAGQSGPAIKIAYFKIGSSVITPSATMTDVSGSVFNSLSNGGPSVQYHVIDQNTVRYTVSLGQTIGDFTIGNVGLFLEDGTMFAIMGMPSTEQKIASNGATVGNAKDFMFPLTISNQATISNFSLLTNNYLSLPRVANESLLPPATPAPIYEEYIVDNHSTWGSPAFAVWVNNQWYYSPITTQTDALNGEAIWLNGLSARNAMADGITPISYTTTTDTGGGAWRRRCENTSWFKEAFSATRGSRKFFPVSVFVVATTSGVTIYDATKVACPMWMKLDTSTSGVLKSAASYTITSIAMAEGVLTIGLKHNSTTAGYLLVIDFVQDTIKSHATTGCTKYDVDISGRNATTVQGSVNTKGALIQGQVNHVAIGAMTGANDDKNAGRRYPVISVATDGGLSVIVDPNTVYNSSDVNAMGFTRITLDAIYYTRKTSTYLGVYSGIPTVNSWNSNRAYDTTTATFLNNAYSQISSLAIGNGNVIVGLQSAVVKVVDGSSTSTAMSYITTPTYVSGWMPSGTGTAVLCNNRTEDVSKYGSSLTQTGTVNLEPISGSNDINMVNVQPASWLQQPWNAVHDWGTDDFLVMAWVRQRAASAAVHTILERAYYIAGNYSGSGIRIVVDNGYVKAYITNNGFTASNDLISAFQLEVGKAQLVRVQRVGAMFRLWVDDRIAAEVPVNVAIGSMTNTNAVLRIGMSLAGTNSGSNLDLAMVRMVANNSTNGDTMRRIYEDEKTLFTVGNAGMLPAGSSAVRSISHDPYTDNTYIATNNGTLVFQGLRLIDQFNSTNYPLLSSNSHVRVSANAYYVAIVSGAEAFFYRYQLTLADAMALYSVGGNGGLTSIAPGSIGTLELATNSVTYPKIQQVTAMRLLGNPTVSTANVQELILDTTLTANSDSRVPTQKAVLTALNAAIPSASKPLAIGSWSSTPTLHWGYNISSISKVSTGIYNVNTSVTFANINKRTVFFWGCYDTGSSFAIHFGTINNNSTSTMVQVTSRFMEDNGYGNTNNPADLHTYYFAMYGDPS